MVCSALKIIAYKQITQKLMPTRIACVGCVDAHTPRAYDCSDLTYHLFDTIGHTRSDMNIRIFGHDFVRHYDIPRIIACHRIGHAHGVYAIGYPRSLLGLTGRRVTTHAHVASMSTSSGIPCDLGGQSVQCVRHVSPGSSDRQGRTQRGREARYGVHIYPASIHRI